MLRSIFGTTALIVFLLLPFPVSAAEGEKSEEGTILTFWPLFDYRESSKEGFRNLALLGPLLKFQRQGNENQTAVRPFFYQTSDKTKDSAVTEVLYPLASSATSPEGSSVQVLKLFQKHDDRPKEGEIRDRGTMLFPFYISGTSEKYGPYTSVFPFYGDIYERFWRDEYHYVLFPLYGRTVKKGTTSTNYLYPFFNTISGERESGFHVWPLYGQAAKEGVYRKHFALWPFYQEEDKGLDTDHPVHKRYILPLYAAEDGPQLEARSFLWPFFGYRSDTGRKEEERDYFWPFLLTIRGENKNVTRFLPVYSEEKDKEKLKRWILWPLYRRDELKSSVFDQERDRLLYFFYIDTRERWPVDGKDRRRTTLWPIFVYNRDLRGVKSFSFPAPVEPILDRDGIEKNWAPLWRLYQQRWNDNGDSAVSFLWNLYWHEVRGNEGIYECFPFVFYRNEQRLTEFSFLKGLVRYRNRGGSKSLTFLWLPFGPRWTADDSGKGAAASSERITHELP